MKKFLVNKEYSVEVIEIGYGGEGEYKQIETFTTPFPKVEFNSLEEILEELKRDWDWLAEEECYFTLSESMLNVYTLANKERKEPTDEELGDWEAGKINLLDVYLTVEVKVIEERDVKKEDLEGTGFTICDD